MKPQPNQNRSTSTTASLLEHDPPVEKRCTRAVQSAVKQIKSADHSSSRGQRSDGTRAGDQD